MEEGNEDDLIMYEGSKEIKESIWESWDILNDNQVIYKLLMNSPLINELKKSNSQIWSINSQNQSVKENSLNKLKDDCEQNSKY